MKVTRQVKYFINIAATGAAVATAASLFSIHIR